MAEFNQKRIVAFVQLDLLDEHVASRIPENRIGKHGHAVAEDFKHARSAERKKRLLVDRAGDRAIKVVDRVAYRQVVLDKNPWRCRSRHQRIPFRQVAVLSRIAFFKIDFGFRRKDPVVPGVGDVVERAYKLPVEDASHVADD
jgi:hypothetical protein